MGPTNGLMRQLMGSDLTIPALHLGDLLGISSRLRAGLNKTFCRHFLG